MPRLNLTDEEASFLEEFRKANNERNAFNNGLDAAADIFNVWAGDQQLQQEQLEDFHQRLRMTRVLPRNPK